ncbi:MAG: DUF3995 domain-containing protein [Fimbriimonadaceae bacterium]|nr:DUF3995 domain-containing protein [Chitinophagales bacterium]
MLYLIIINTIIFLFLSCLHFYWAAGGKHWFYNSLPQKESTNAYLFIPGKFSCIVVATGLFIFALITIGNLGIFDNYINKKFIYYGNWIITIIFFLRGLGDFRYAGFFKKIKTTIFARNDTKYYAPLCISIATISLIIILFN